MTPNPGSDEAAAQGCTCARMDNEYGRGVMVGGEARFWITGDCPLHDLKEDSLVREGAMQTEISYWLPGGYRIVYSGTPKTRWEWIRLTWRGYLACWQAIGRLTLTIAKAAAVEIPK